jgi:hypothetical protein
MDCVWHLGAWIDVLSLPVPDLVAESEEGAFRVRLTQYLERCAMVLEDWDQRDAEWLGEFRWGWVDYERQLAYLGVDVDGFPDLRLFVWVNDFAYAGLQSIHVVAVTEDGRAYLERGGSDMFRRRDELITQLAQAGQ